MAKRLYLHVGMDKTGTSAIQRFVYENRQRIASELGVCYPVAGLWSDYSHHPYAFSIVQQFGYSVDALPPLLEQLRDETAQHESVLLSSECLFKSPRRPNFGRFWDFVQSVFEEVRVVVYVRRQDLWVESRHKHSILSGAEIDLEKLSQPWFCNYKQFIDDWAALVGRKAVSVRAYDRKQFHGGNIFADFLSVFGAEMSEGFRRPDNTVNSSLGGWEALYKRLCNRIEFFGEGVDGLNVALLEHSKRPSGDDCRMMSAEQERQLVETYAETNAAIAREYLCREDGELFGERSGGGANGHDACRELSDEQIRDISVYIAESSPETMALLRAHVADASEAADAGVSRAAKQLLSGMQ